MLTRHSTRIGLALCVPIPYVRRNGQDVLDTVSWNFLKHYHALQTPTNFNLVTVEANGLEVGDARNKVVQLVLETEPRPEYCFFLDYDVLLPYDSLVKLLHWAAHRPQYDVYAGVYCLKSANPEPLIYAGDGGGPFWDWTVGDILTTDSHGITGCHMGLTLLRMSLFDRLSYSDEKPWFKSVNERGTREDGRAYYERGSEDLWFTRRLVTEANGKILIDTSVLAGHEDKATGKVYGLPLDVGPAARAKWLPSLEPGQPSPDRQQADEKGLKLALDLGAGANHQEVPGHVVYTTDARADVGADYVQDTLQLNLPDNHYDLVTSRHHLEHLGRWDQERAWAEIFRVTVPGGRTRQIVPSLDWAAEKVRAGEQDEDTWNVLYGAQEAHGFGRELNAHYFGYTRAIGRALAETAGFVDVTCTDWLVDEALGYNLVIEGRKPKKGEAKKAQAKEDAQQEDQKALPMPASNGKARAGKNGKVASKGRAKKGTVKARA